MPPMKLLFSSRTDSCKYGVVASSIQQLKDIAKNKFQLHYDASTLVLELEDGTIVEDEDYFSCLESDTCIVVSAPKCSVDAVDGNIQYDGPNAEAGRGGTSLHYAVRQEDDTDIHKLAYRLHKDITSIVKFSNKQLEAIANATQEDLRQLLSYMTLEEIDALQESCHAHLVEREKTTEAITLLRLINDDKEPPHKRPRPSSD